MNSKEKALLAGQKSKEKCILNYINAVKDLDYDTVEKGMIKKAEQGSRFYFFPLPLQWESDCTKSLGEKTKEKMYSEATKILKMRHGVDEVRCDMCFKGPVGNLKQKECISFTWHDKTRL